jgi:hypothetical protein
MTNVYRDILAIQDACNASGLMMATPKFADAVWEELRAFGLGGTHNFRMHPVVVLFANKLADLTGQTISNDRFGPAYDLATRLTSTNPKDQPLGQGSPEHKAALEAYFNAIYNGDKSAW